MSDVQCTRIRFNSDRLVETDADTQADKMGPIFSIATDLRPSSRADIGVGEDPSDEDEAASDEAFSPPKAKKTRLETASLDSTFTVEDQPASEDALLAPEEMEVDEDTPKAEVAEQDEEHDTREVWRPPTPPRKLVVEKENLDVAPRSSKVDSPMRKHSALKTVNSS